MGSIGGGGDGGLASETDMNVSSRSVILCSEEEEDENDRDNPFRIPMRTIKKFNEAEWRNFMKDIGIKYGKIETWTTADFTSANKLNKVILEFYGKIGINSNDIWKTLLGIAKAVSTNMLLWSYEFHKNLIPIIYKCDPTVHSKQIIYFSQTMYAVTWNYMGENHKNLTPTQIIQLIAACFQWYFSQENPNLEKVGSKLVRVLYVLPQHHRHIKSDGEAGSKLIKFFLDVIIERLEPIVYNINGPQVEAEAVGFLLIISSVSKISSAYSITEYYEKCLSLMGCWMAKKKSFPLAGPYDIMHPEIEVWSSTLTKIKFEANNPEIEMTMLSDIVKNISETPSAKLLKKVILFELNSCFTTRHVLSNAIITIGEQLEDHGETETYCGLGLITQAIGFWWGGEIDDQHPLNLCKEALELLNVGARKEPDDPVLLIVAAMAKIWLGLTYLRLLQVRSQRELESMRELVKESNPKKYKSVSSMKGRIVPTISSVNLKDENDVANMLISGIDYLYTLINFEDSFKSWVDTISPALLIVTTRIAATQLTIYGETYTSIRAWWVLWTLTKIYSNNYIQMQAGVELLRLVPCLDQDFVLELEDIKNKMDPNRGLPPAHMLMINIAKSSAALQRREYDEGLQYLSEVLSVLRSEVCTLDIGHLVLAEAYSLLAQYKAVSSSSNLDLCAFPISSNLIQMTPSALALKALRIAHSLSRTPDPDRISGWQDLAFNNCLLISCVKISTKTFEFMKSYGRLKDLRCYSADLFFFFQQMCLVSRSTSILLLLAEMDLFSNNVDSSQLKLDAIYKLLNVEILAGAVVTEMPEEEVKNFAKSKLLLDASIVELVRNPPWSTWALTTLDLPVHYYKGSKIENVMGFQNQYSMPKFFHHSLSCSCYVCLHPFIISNFIKFMNLQARFALYQSKQTRQKGLEQTILSLAQSHLVRSMFRILLHVERMGYRLSQAFVEELIGEDALERCYKDFFLKTEIHLLTTHMEITPSKDFDEIWNKSQKLVYLYEELDDEQSFKQFIPLEIGAAAIFNAMEKNEDSIIKNSEFRSILMDAIRMAENVTENVDAVTPPMSKDEQRQGVRPPPSPPKKRMGRRLK